MEMPRLSNSYMMHNASKEAGGSPWNADLTTLNVHHGASGADPGHGFWSTPVSNTCQSS